MLTTGSYITAWLIYMAAVTGLVIATPSVLRIFKSAKFILLFRLLLAALLLTPVASAPGVETFAPAIMVGVFELFVGSEDAARSVLPLLFGVSVVSIIWLLLYLTIRRGKGIINN